MTALKKKTRRPRPANAIQITVWDVTGATLPEDAVKALESAVERVTLELFNEGRRLLTQTNRG
jgi:hypothetical protein